MILTIDYLILNFEGTLKLRKGEFYQNDTSGNKTYIQSTAETLENPFHTVRHEYGNKTFTEVYDLFYQGEKVALINAVPRSAVLNSELIQMQFENHLFYTKDLRGLGQLVNDIVNYFDVKVKGINRLDIAHDRSDYCDAYTSLYIDLIEGKKKLKGREKKVAAYMLTKNGLTTFEGFTVGKRTSSRMLRIYNKTKALQDPKTPKSYINDYFQKNHLANTATNPVWRYEYQLNSTFFTYMRERGQHVTTQIFDLEFLLQLIQIAEKNHFEIVHNTDKSETNKEKPFEVINWSEVRKQIEPEFSLFQAEKIKKPFEPSITVQKRLVKGLFRQYYVTADYIYLNALCSVIRQYDFKDWFYDKYNMYVLEFQAKEKLLGCFDEPQFTTMYYALTHTI